MIPTIYWISAVGAGRLAIVPRPRGGDWLPDEMIALTSAGIQSLISCLTQAEEAELDLMGEAREAKAVGLEFVSLPIEDRAVPSNAEMLRRTLSSVYHRLVSGRSVAVHCRQSIGRASLVAALLLTRHGVAPDEAWRLIETARERSVPDTDEQRAWVRRFSW